jgi:AcrR family transcriptional regulator
MSPRESRESTREKLLEAAGQVIAEKGYHAATVREICDRAGANVAAINYHFGDKQKLQEALLLHVLRGSMRKHAPERAALAGAPPRERLLAFVRTFLLTRLDPDQPPWHRKLFMRESVEPSGAMRALVEKGIRGHFKRLKALVAEIAGKGTGAKQVEQCVASVVGQCLYYAVAQHVIPRVYKHVKLDARGVEEIARHIVEFSLGGIAGRAAGSARKSGTGKKRSR